MYNVRNKLEVTTLETLTERIEKLRGAVENAPLENAKVICRIGVLTSEHLQMSETRPLESTDFNELNWSNGNFTRFGKFNKS